VELSQHGLVIARRTRLGGFGSPEHLPVESVPGSGSNVGAAEPWRAAVDRLAQWLTEQKGQRTRVHVLLSGRFVRWQLLPWRTELTSLRERAAFAALRLREVFGKSVEGWTIAPAGVAPGHTAPVAAIDRALLVALQQACESAGAQLQQVGTTFSQAFDNHRHAIQGSPAWFGTLEADTLTLGLLVQGEWVALQSQRLAADAQTLSQTLPQTSLQTKDWHAPLLALKTQMAVASGVTSGMSIDVAAGQTDAATPLYLAADRAQPEAPPGLVVRWLPSNPSAGGALSGLSSGLFSRLPSLQLNWLARPRIVSPLGLLLAGAGLMCAAWVTLNYLEVDAERSALLARQARLERADKATASDKTGTKPTTALAPLARDDAQTATQIAAQLQLPWDGLLHTLEQHPSKSVALISVDVQAASSSLRLVGEARTMADALAYARSLRQSSQVQKVFVSGQEEKMAGPQKVLRFSLDADWKTVP
jgi:hypothetical protein